MRQALILAIRLYQLSLAAVLGGHCRFEPSCSHYASEAIERHGAIHGVRLAVGRIFRCHPFARAGYDPVPLGHNARHAWAYPRPQRAREEGCGRGTTAGGRRDGH
jgi:putative membrane protein insertion efficiency factor